MNNYILEILNELRKKPLKSKALEPFDIRYYCFMSEKERFFYKLDALPVILYDDKDIQALLDSILLEEDRRLYIKHAVYNIDYAQSGEFFRWELQEERFYKRYIIYLNRRYVIQLQSFTKEHSKNLNTIVFMKQVRSIGRDAYNNVNSMLRENNILNDKETLLERLTTRATRKYKDIFKLCVFGQISYIDEYRRASVIDYVYKADISSAFPSQLLKYIPTLKGCVIDKKNEQKPTKERPFVFSFRKKEDFGRVQILEEDGTIIDTKKDIKSFYMLKVLNDMINSATKKQIKAGAVIDRHNKEHIRETHIEDDFISISCKASDIKLDYVMKLLYEQKRNGSEKAKLTMNSFIGYLQRNMSPSLSFISAVVIARQNNLMLKYCKELEKAGNIILYIATDSIVWRGFEHKIATNNKYMGSFTYEFKEAKFYGLYIGAYQIEDAGKVYTTCSYLPNDKNKEALKLGELPPPKEKRL